VALPSPMTHDWSRAEMKLPGAGLGAVHFEDQSRAPLNVHWLVLIECRGSASRVLNLCSFVGGGFWRCRWNCEHSALRVSFIPGAWAKNTPSCIE
jgi:hypothetical protein